MDSAGSAEPLRGVVLEVGAANTGRVSVFDTARKYSQFYRSYCVHLNHVGMPYFGYYPYLQHLGLYIAYTARTVSNSAVNVDSSSASSIRSTKILSKAPITCRGRSMQGESAKQRLFSFSPSDKTHDPTCSHEHTIFQIGANSCENHTYVCGESKGDKRQATSDI